MPPPPGLFRRFQLARVLSILGLQMLSVAVGWHVFSLTGRPLDLGWVGLAQFLPGLALTLITGHVADRFDRARILGVCWVVVAACALLLLGLVAGGIRSPAPIYAALVLLGCARAFSGPANRALLPALVPEGELGRAVGWSASIWQFGAIAGPAAGGFLCGLGGGAGPVYALTAVLALLAAVLVFALPVRSRGGTTGLANWQTLGAGFRAVWRNRILLGALSLDLAAVLLGGAVALMPIFARDILHVGAEGLGVLRSAPAAGAALCAVALARRPIRGRAGTWLFASVAVFGLGTIAFGVSRSFVASVVALVVLGAADMVSVVIRQTLVQLHTPDDLRGRVNAVDMAFIGASNELGEFESGVTAAWLGPVTATVIGGAGACAVVLLWAALFPALRRADTLEPPRSDAG